MRAAQHGEHAAHEPRAVGAAPLRIIVTKMLADVPETGGAQQRIAQRMQDHIAVGVRDDSAAVAAHAPRRASRSRRRQRHDVDTGSDSHGLLRAGARQAAPRRRRRSSRLVTLMFAAEPSTRSARAPVHSSAWDSSVGTCAQHRAPRRAPAQAPSETSAASGRATGRFDPPSSTAVLQSAPYLRVSATGHREKPPSLIRSDHSAAGQVGGGQDRVARHRAPAPSRLGIGQRLERPQAVRTESTALRAAGRRCDMRRAGDRRSCGHHGSARARATTMPAQRASSRNGRSAHSMTVRPQQAAAYCLGTGLAKAAPGARRGHDEPVAHQAGGGAQRAAVRTCAAGAGVGLRRARPGRRFRCRRSSRAHCGRAPRARPCRSSGRALRRPAAGCALRDAAFSPAAAATAPCMRPVRARRCPTARAGTAGSR